MSTRDPQRKKSVKQRVYLRQRRTRLTFQIDCSSSSSEKSQGTTSMMTLLETGRKQATVSPLALLTRDSRTCVVWTQSWRGQRGGRGPLTCSFSCCWDTLLRGSKKKREWTQKEMEGTRKACSVTQMNALPERKTPLTLKQHWLTQQEQKTMAQLNWTLAVSHQMTSLKNPR